MLAGELGSRAKNPKFTLIKASAREELGTRRESEQ